MPKGRLANGLRPSSEREEMHNDRSDVTIGEICRRVTVLTEEINGLYIALGGRSFGADDLEDEKNDDPNWPPIKKLMAVRFRDCVKFKTQLMDDTVSVSDYISFEPTTNIEGVK